jgi:hypothetical protein
VSKGSLLNPVLRGWGNYFRTGNADREFNKIDDYVHERVLRWQWRQGAQRTRFRFDRWPHKRLHEMGLHRPMGTVKYPQAATPRKPCQENSLVSRVRGAACTGVDHAGESPAAAIARFGCVAMSDARDWRRLGAQARARVLGADMDGLTRQGGERTSGPQRERTLQRRDSVPTRYGLWGIEQPSLSRTGEGQWAPMKVTGQGSRRLLRRIGGGTEELVSDPKQRRSRGRKAQGASREARPWVMARLTDRVVVAGMPMDSITSAEQRTHRVAACSGSEDEPRHANWVEPPSSGRSTKGAPNSLREFPRAR